MKTTIFILFAILSILFVSYSKIYDGNDLLAINHFATFKYTYSNDSTYTEIDSLKIIYNGNNTIYEIPTINYSSKKQNSSSDSLVYELRPSDTTSTFYLIKKGFRHGLKYSSSKNSQVEKFQVDTFLIDKGLNDENMVIYSMDFGKIFKTIKTKFEQVDIHTPPKLGVDYVDTVFRYYNKRLSKIPFTYSRKLDSMYNSKLFKIHLITLYQKSNDNTKPYLVRDDIIQKIELVKIKNRENILAIIKQFERDITKLNLQ